MIYFLLSYHNSYDRCAIPDDNVDEEKVDPKVEDGENKKEEDDNDLEISDKEVNRKNYDKEEDSPKNIKEEIPKNLSFVK